jgi:uncharacterized protein
MKIGIIGGGAAGLTTAWLLDGDHQIVLFEKQPRLGGHAHTIEVPIDGKSVSIEIGFEFFNKTLFPHFNRLLFLLKVPVKTFPLTYTFYSTQTKQAYALPPLQQGKFPWELLSPSTLIKLLQLNYFLQQGKKIVHSSNKNKTLEEFADSLFFLSPSCKNNFLYPLLASGWGAMIDDFKQFAVYDMLKWISTTSLGLWPETWKEITGGTSSYIQALSKQLTTTTIKLSSAIKNISFEENSYQVTNNDGMTFTFDHLIFATDPQEACKLLTTIAGTASIQSILKQIDYFPSCVTVHGDSSFMPEKKSDWSIANVRFDGKNGALTIYKSWKSSVPLFRSWIICDPHESLEDKMPKNLYAVEYFRHQKVTPDYFKAQQELKLLQGVNNLWFAGHYTHDFDSHENAIVSALLVAQKIAPHSERLQLLNSITSKTIS